MRFDANRSIDTTKRPFSDYLQKLVILFYVFPSKLDEPFLINLYSSIILGRYGIGKQIIANRGLELIQLVVFYAAAFWLSFDSFWFGFRAHVFFLFRGPGLDLPHGAKLKVIACADGLLILVLVDKILQRGWALLKGWLVGRRWFDIFIMLGFISCDLGGIMNNIGLGIEGLIARFISHFFLLYNYRIIMGLWERHWFQVNISIFGRI